MILELGRFQRRSKELGAWWRRFIKAKPTNTTILNNKSCLIGALAIF
jgi:hypothetical protein